jgi:aryl-alcohol dehydrogenase-like predicted oxidoreductase
MILGMDRLDQVEQNLEFLNFPIPEDLWKDLLNEKLIDERCPI